MPFDGCQGEECHCQSVRILAYIAGRQRICPVCSETLHPNEDTMTVEEMVKYGDSEPKLLGVHIECQAQLVKVRDTIQVENMLKGIEAGKNPPRS